MPLIMELGIEGTNKEEGKEKNLITKTQWDDEAKRICKDRIDKRLKKEKLEENAIEKIWEKIKKTVRRLL